MNSVDSEPSNISDKPLYLLSLYRKSAMKHNLNGDAETAREHYNRALSYIDEYRQNVTEYDRHRVGEDEEIEDSIDTILENLDLIEENINNALEDL